VDRVFAVMYGFFASFIVLLFLFIGVHSSMGSYCPVTVYKNFIGFRTSRTTRW